MFQLGVPVHQKDVTKAVRPEHLVPWFPRTSWDGYFAIAVFPRGSEIKWLKAHLFRAACGPDDTPLAAVEGFLPKSDMLVTWATRDGVIVLEKDVDASRMESRANPLRVALEDVFLLEGRAPRYLERFSIPDRGASVEFAFEAGWPIWWSRWGRILTYAGQHSAVGVELSNGRERHRLRGLGVMEHVCGISLPFDFTRLMPFHYHWDVLYFEGGESPTDSAAGLSIGLMGKTLVRLRSAARFPGYAPEATAGLSVEYLDVGSEPSERGEIMAPQRWRGALSGRVGAFTYTATASTSVAGIIPGGGMLGFEFEGRLDLSSGGSRDLQGTGFTEYGDFSGMLRRIGS